MLPNSQMVVKKNADLPWVESVKKNQQLKQTKPSQILNKLKAPPPAQLGSVWPVERPNDDRAWGVST